MSPEDVPPEEYRRVTEHLASCSVCRKVQEDLGALERAAAEIGVPDPGDGYWNNFALQVRHQVGAKPAGEPAWWVRWFVHRPVVSWPATAVAALVVVFLVRTMLPGDKVPIRISDEQASPPATKSEVGAPALAKQSGENEPSIQRAESQPAGSPETIKPGRQEEPVTLAEEAPTVPSTTQPAGKTPEFKPDAVPTEERQFAAAERGTRLLDTGPPARTTVILRGDTVGAEINKGLPEGRELELAERPNAPFPTGDTSSIQGQRVLGAPVGEGYGGVTPQTPALNRGEFTAQDREFFAKQIAKLSTQLGKEKGEARRATCRALVDMYYQLAMNWRSPTDIEQAIDFMAGARKILPDADYPDLDAKTAALKSLSGR